MSRYFTFLMLYVIVMACNPPKARNAITDPLPSWNEGPTKEAIVEFVTHTTNPDDRYFIPEEERIAVFDNDGTLWSERPYYFQFEFAFDMVRAHAAGHDEWKEEQPFKGILENDYASAFASGDDNIGKLLVATHTGMYNDVFEQTVSGWIDTARHDVNGRLYRDLVFQPMLELLDYFRANGFTTYIVSGGSIAFMQPWTEQLYDIPSEQVIGSRFKLVYEYTDNGPELYRAPQFEFLNDKGGKVVSISQVIGKRPVAAFGNSDGDLAMLRYTADGNGMRLMAYIHHTDAEREYAYDRDSPVGELDEGLDVARANNWLLVDMKKDWKTIYPGN
jgi:phosphoglycolate phosphatase-like HAD superfamily hydrolase